MADVNDAHATGTASNASNDTWPTRRKNATGFIIGGQAVHATQFPFYVRLLLNGRFGCGGSLIAQDVVLTSGHCVDKSADLRLYQVETRSQERVPVSGMTIHPQYRGELSLDFRFDVALLILALPVQTATPATLAQREPQPGDRVTLIGMGMTTTNVIKPSKDLRMIVKPILHSQRCHGLDAQFDQTTMICVDGTNMRSTAFGKFVDMTTNLNG
jgi:secreted trypsin-like serine protease